MRKHLGAVVLAAAVFGVGLVAGCANKTALRDQKPADPLLTSKKPIDGRPQLGDTPPVSEEDYSPPQRPADDRPVGLRAPNELR